MRLPRLRPGRERPVAAMGTTLRISTPGHSASSVVHGAKSARRPFDDPGALRWKATGFAFGELRLDGAAWT